MISICPQISDDGSISLFSQIENDIYHSKIGAYTEALEKFIKPSGIIHHVKENNDVKILDVCFGMGYNSKTALNEIYKANPECKITVDCLDNDACMFMLAGIINYERICNEVQQPFADMTQYLSEMPQYNNLFANLKEEMRKHKILEPHFEEFDKNRIESSVDTLNRSLLHNIYYRSIPFRNNKIEKAHYESDKLEISYYIADAREAVQALNSQYDCILLDGFTPHKAPSLWTVEIMKRLYSVAKDNGCVITYTSSAAVRSAFIDAGFYIYRTQPVGRKSSGTIAFKKVQDNIDVLTARELELLDTRAGIPYRDMNMTLSNAEILNNRESEQSLSDRPSTSAYFKKNVKL